MKNALAGMRAFPEGKEIARDLEAKYLDPQKAQTIQLRVTKENCATEIVNIEGGATAAVEYARQRVVAAKHAIKALKNDQEQPPLAEAAGPAPT